VPLQPDTTALAEALRTEDSLDFFRDQAGRSVTIIRDARIPLVLRPGERVLLAGSDRDFLRVGSEFLPEAGILRLEFGRPFETNTTDMMSFRDVVSEYETVVFCLSDLNTMQFVNSIEATGREVVILSILDPIFLRQLDWVDTALAVYGWGEESLRSGFSALLGLFEPDGTLPLSFDQQFD
jgi:beta-N-acetylhexosaminidase